MKKEEFTFEIKSAEVTDAGTFEGLASPYNLVDQGADVVLPGAYTKTLQEQGNTRPLLWQHDTKNPVGQVMLEERTSGLWCKGKLLLSLPSAQNAYLLIKAGIVTGLSIGFESVKDSVQNGVRYLSEIKLWEISAVTFPMAESALITTVKTFGSRITPADPAHEEIAKAIEGMRIKLRIEGLMMDVRRQGRDFNK